MPREVVETEHRFLPESAADRIHWQIYGNLDFGRPRIQT